MPEDGHTRVRPRRLDEPRRQREVVILHKDNGLGTALHLLQQRSRKLLVHTLVPLPVRSAEDGPGVRNMTERPQTLIGKAVVVACLLLAREPHPAQCVAGIARRHAEAIELVDVQGVLAAAAVRHPHAVTGPQHRLDGRH